MDKGEVEDGCRQGIARIKSGDLGGALESFSKALAQSCCRGKPVARMLLHTCPAAAKAYSMNIRFFDMIRRPVGNRTFAIGLVVSSTVADFDEACRKFRQFIADERDDLDPDELFGDIRASLSGRRPVNL